jgi:hypothetical protein
MPRGFAPAKKDGTQPAVEDAFARAGWALCDTHALGKDAPDLFVSKLGATVAIEVKTGRARRRAHQVEWADRWKGLYLWGSDPLVLLEQAEAMLRQEEPF